MREDFCNTPGFGYRLFGVDQLLVNVKQALTDIEAAKSKLQHAPTRDQLEQTINQQQLLYKKILTEHADQAVKFFHCDVMIDGRDILALRGEQYKIEHLRWDGPQIRDCHFVQALPESPVTVIPLDIDSRPMHPFILEQPTADNDYTAKVYLYDKPGGHGLMEFDLYYIPKSPKELGLVIPWEK